MKKLGLRVLAGSLAALMVASTFAPVKTASATSGIVIAPAPTALKTLHITADMVDDDGEIIISGETWDRVVISKEAAAKEIYLDEVKVGELVVESGNSANIKLWKVDAEQVTVKEPELVALTVSDLRSLLADPATQQQAMNLYEKAQAQNERILKKTPTIVTMEDATVGEVVARANARLELGAGSVGSLALEASDKVERVNVTVENYDGNVSYKGTDTLNVMNFKSVNSKIKNLTVEESTANNYFNVKNKDSVAVAVEVAGNAQVSLNIPMGTLNIAEAATKAQVAVLNAVEEMNVAANGAQVEISPIGNVTSATVDGDNVTIGGAGVLAEVNINGKGAYVSTEGTDVEGENTYVKPEYVAPKVEIKDIDMTGGDGAEVTKNSNGSATIKFTGQYKTASFAVPSEVDVSRIASVVLNITTNAQFCVKLVAKTGAEITVAYPGYGITEDTKDDYLYSYSPAQYKLGKINIMSLGTSEVTVNSIVFNLLDKAPEAEPTPEVSAPGELPSNYVVYKVSDLEQGGYGYTPSEALHDGISVKYDGQYQEIQFALPEALAVSDYKEMIVTISNTVDGAVAVKAIAESGTLNTWYGKTAEDTTDIKIDITALSQSESITKVALMANDDASSVIVYRVAFVPKAGTGNTPTPTPTPAATLPELPANSVVYTFAEEDGLTKASSGDWGTTKNVTEDGALEVVYSGNNAEARYVLPVSFDSAKYEKMIVTAKTTGTLAVKAINGSNEQTKAWYNLSSESVKNFEFDLSELTAAVAGVGIMANGDACEATIYRIAFVPKATSDTVTITDPAKTSLVMDETLTLSADASDTVTWSSSNPNVATVEESTGKVTAVASGTVTITATCGTATDTVTLTVENAFYLKNAEAFSLTVGSGKSAAVLSNYYLDGTNFTNKLPSALKNNETASEKFKTMTGIVEMVKSFEFSITLTDATSADSATASYEPQAEVVVQGNGEDGSYTNNTYKNKWVGIGEATASAPKTGTTTFYFANQKFDDASGDPVTWTDQALGQAGITIKNAAADSTVAGTYTIKVILNDVVD